MFTYRSLLTKRFCFIVVLLSVFAINMFGQRSLVFPYENCSAIVYWEKDTTGLYVLKENIIKNCDSVFPDKIISFNSKDGKMYVYTEQGIYMYLFSKYGIKNVKTLLASYKIPSLDENVLTDNIETIKEMLSNKYEKYNDEVLVARQNKLNEQNTLDSLYRAAHPWNRYTFSEDKYCYLCDAFHATKNKELYIAGFSENTDTIFYFNKADDADFVIPIMMVHNLCVGRKDNAFMKFLTLNGDSIKSNSGLTSKVAMVWNLNELVKYEELEKQERNAMMKRAPYGFIQEWGWTLNSAAGIESHFSYTLIPQHDI